MQIGLPINVTPTPATAAPGLAKGAVATDPTLAATSPATTAPATDASADALLMQDLGGAQFAGLLAGAPVKSSALTAAAPDANAKTNTKNAPTTPTGDAATPPQSSSIAIPPIAQYIDQQPVQNVVLAQNDAVGDATSGSKKFIFSDPNSAPTLAPASGSTAILANEVAAGSVALNGTGANDNNATAQDPEFTKAVAQIVQQAKDKAGVTSAPAPASTSTSTSSTPPQATNATNDAPSADATTAAKAAGTADQTTTAQALNQTQQMAGKISAKILGIKEDKVDTADDSTTAQMTAKLADFSTQLSTKSYTQIQAATATMAASPVDQINVQISQALNSNTNSIKINLHPAELGSVDVDMDTDSDGNTKINITADKAETLQLLKQDSTHLVKSLSDIGIKADSSSLQFSLRGDQQNQQQQQQANMQNSFGGQQQQSQQQASNTVTTTYSRFTSAQDLTLSSNDNGLNILV